MEQGRRGRTQEDDARNATVDGDIGVFPSSRNVDRLEGGGTESESCEHFDNRDNVDGGDSLVDVDRRTDNGAGCRQWHQLDNLRGNSGGIAEEHWDNLPIFASRHDKLFQRVIVWNNSGRNDSFRYLCGSRVQARTDNVCKARSRSAGVWRTQQPHTAQSESSRRNTDNLCVECVNVSDNSCAIYRQSDDKISGGVFAMGNALADCNICSVDNLLHIFLHGGNGENTRYGREFEEVRRICTRNKTRTTDGRLYRPRIDAADVGRKCILGVRGGIAKLDSGRDEHTRRILWRDGVIDSSKCRLAHDEADRSDGRNAAL